MQFVTNGPEVPGRLLQAHENGHLVSFCGAGVLRTGGAGPPTEVIADFIRGPSKLARSRTDLQGVADFHVAAPGA